MSGTENLVQVTTETAPLPSTFRAFWRSFAENRGAVGGLVVLFLLVVTAVFADVVAPHSPIEQFREHFLTPPVWQGGDGSFPLGTDDVGRDMLSRLIYGARLSLLIGFVVVTLALLVGSGAGAAGGVRGRDRRHRHHAG